jgi:hypothetical protein
MADVTPEIAAKIVK